MQSASDTPSSHLWEWCEAGIELAMMSRAPRTQGEPGPKGCRRAQSFWDMDVPKCITSTATLRWTTGLRRTAIAARHGERSEGA